MTSVESWEQAILRERAIKAAAKPCPFCGCRDIILGGASSANWRMVCHDCGAEIPAKEPDTPEEALRKWNDRPKEYELQGRIAEMEIKP